jgi:hypothetical protein
MLNILVVLAFVKKIFKKHLQQSTPLKSKVERVCQDLRRVDTGKAGKGKDSKGNGKKERRWLSR